MPIILSLLNGQDISGMSIRERGEKIGLVMQSPGQMISKPMIYEEVAQLKVNMLQHRVPLHIGKIQIFYGKDTLLRFGRLFIADFPKVRDR